MYVSCQIKTPITVLPREDLLFTECATCGNYLTWRAHAKLVMFSASCCGMVFTSAPKDNYLRMFVVSMTPADMTNVIIMSVVA